MIFQEHHILPKFLVHLKKKSESITNSSPSSKVPSDWHVEEVILWIKSLNLAKDYSNLIKEAHITGKALRTMKTSADWKELGVTVFGDLRALSSAVTELFP